MIALAALMAAALTGPDADPARAAVQGCDKPAMARLTRAEPHRRADFAAAAYAEQQAIARERAGLYARPAGDATAAGQATLNTALAALDARQKQLDDARAVERGWRDLIDELRADYLANCTSGK